MGFFEDKHPVTTTIMFVLALAAVLAVFPGNNITGSATRTEVEILPFPVYVEEFAHTGWGDCTNTIIQWTYLDNYCKSLDKGYVGAADEKWQPCLHVTSPTRWYWDGSLPVQKGAVFTTGLGLTQVKCLY